MADWDGGGTHATKRTAGAALAVENIGRQLLHSCLTSACVEGTCEGFDVVLPFPSKRSDSKWGA